MSVSVHKSRRGYPWRSLKVDIGRAHAMATVATDLGYRWAVGVSVGRRRIDVQGDGHHVVVHRAALG
jgi:hypothetical protein